MAGSILLVLGVAALGYAAAFWLRFPLIAPADLLMRTEAPPPRFSE